MSLTTINGRAVSTLCLGTMTWGEQNSEAEGHEQISYALDNGINFMDCAEMYPVPPVAETAGRSEEIIGTWLAKNGRREDWVIATKAAGPGASMDYLRGGPKHNLDYLSKAVDDSLRRMQTDYIDLYQLHWPERSTNIFGQLGYRHRESDDTPIQETLEALQTLIKSGKIRSIGLSNENPWGTMRYLELARSMGLPKIESVQNVYNLLSRVYEIGMAEISHREDVGLLAYSPMAFGALSGKYRNGAKPPKARITLYERFARYSSPQSTQSIDAYCDLAESWGMEPAQMALAFVSQQPFVLSNIIGATTMEQLKTNIASQDIVLDKDQIKAINKIHAAQPNPAP